MIGRFEYKKNCLYCGKEFVDKTLNHIAKFCSVDCRKLNRAKVCSEKRDKLLQTGKYYVGSRSYLFKRNYSEWEIQPVCKTCGYRKALCSKYAGGEQWDNTYCSYLEVNNELRGCEPVGNECSKYIPKE